MSQKRKDPLAEEMGQRVRAVMLELEMTTADLAELVQENKETLYGALAGQHRIQHHVILRLPAVLHRSLYYIYGLPEPGGLSAEEHEIISRYRSYKNPRRRESLLAAARWQSKDEEAWEAHKSLFGDSCE